MSQSLTVDFGLNIDWTSFNSAVSSVNKLDRQVSRFISGAEKIATVFAAGGVAASVFKWAEGAVEKYAEAERSTVQFTHAMNQLGITSRETVADFLSFASAQSKSAMATKGEILETERLLSTFGVSGDALKRTTTAALDLSTGLGVNLHTATMMLGKAFEGNTASLSKLGISIADNTPKTQIFAEVLRQVEERFGGSSSAEMDTYSGKLNLLHKGFGEIYKAIGKDLMPAAKWWLSWLNDLHTVLEYSVPKLETFAVKVRQVWSAIQDSKSDSETFRKRAYPQRLCADSQFSLISNLNANSCLIS